MAGNVWNWCADGYDADLHQQPESRRDDLRQEPVTGILAERGGSWIGLPNWLALLPARTPACRLGFFVALRRWATFESRS